jgi:hypothetical protein
MNTLPTLLNRSYPVKGEKFACATVMGGDGPLTQHHCCIGSLAPSLLRTDEFYQPSYFEAEETEDIPFDTSTIPVELTQPPFTGEYEYSGELIPGTEGVSLELSLDVYSNGT